MSAPSLSEDSHSQRLAERPIFASEESEYLSPIKPPVSRLALCSLLFGMLGGIALFNFDLVVLPILAAALGLATYLLIAKSDAVSGQFLALLGMTLGIVFGLASYTSTKMRDQYLFGSASQFASKFLDVVAQDKLLDAYELTRTEGERHVAGTSLDEAYRLAPETTKSSIDGFKSETAVRKVVSIGTSAKWQLQSGVRVTETQGNSVHVVVRMVNTAKDGGETVDVNMARDFFAGVGSWYVVNVR